MSRNYCRKSERNTTSINKKKRENGFYTKIQRITYNRERGTHKREKGTKNEERFSIFVLINIINNPLNKY